MKVKKQPELIPKKKFKSYLYILLLILVPLLLNLKTISYNYTTCDDNIIIKNNYGFLSDIGNIFNAFEKDNFLSKDGKSYYRPVQTISFMIDAQFNGDKLEAFHFSNLLYHILTVILLFFLLRKIDVREDISFFLSLLFSVHPLFTNAIAWLPGRGDILAGLFGLASVISFLSYVSGKKGISLIIHGVTFFLALFSKELSLFIPFVLIFYYWYVRGNRYRIIPLIPFIVIWCVSGAAFFFMNYTFLNPQNVYSIKAFISNLPAIPVYMGKLFFPFFLSPMPVYDIYFTVTGVLLFILLIIFLLKKRVKNIYLILFGLFWFVGLILPSMFVRIPLGRFQFEYLECRAFLPSVGFFIMAAVILNEFITSKKFSVLATCFVPVILLFSFLSYNYSGSYDGPLSFYSSVIKQNSENAFSLCSRGCFYFTNGKPDLALADFESSIRVIPSYSEAYYDIGALHNSAGKPILAEQYFTLALKYDTLYSQTNTLHEYAFINLASVKLSLKKYDETIDLMKKALVKYPDNSSLHNNLGLAYYSKSCYDTAILEYNRAIASDIYSSPSYYNNRGMAKFQMKDYQGALTDFNSAISINPQFLDTWTNRGITKIELNDNEGSISDFNEAIRFNPKNGIAFYFRGNALFNLNKKTEARDNWQKALNLGLKKAEEKLSTNNGTK